MKYNFKTVLCPKCGAPEGFQCKTANGRKVTESYPHIDRVHAFAAKQRVTFSAEPAISAADLRRSTEPFVRTFSCSSLSR